MKETYETPTCEIIEFETEDVITGSGGGNINANMLNDDELS